MSCVIPQYRPWSIVYDPWFSSSFSTCTSVATSASPASELPRHFASFPGRESGEDQYTNSRRSMCVEYLFAFIVITQTHRLWSRARLMRLDDVGSAGQIGQTNRHLGDRQIQRSKCSAIHTLLDTITVNLTESNRSGPKLSSDICEIRYK